ncbi:DUF881 domain-containing protein [Bacillaceae bacterium SIJ1]|nr:DUF881 domain-containing protein [Litoribacterium kuwaitense]
MKVNKTVQKSVLFIVLAVLGFLLAFSYQNTKQSPPTLSSDAWEEEYELREELISIEQQNLELTSLLSEKKTTIQQMENEFANQEDTLFNLVEEVEKLRMLIGDIPIQGPGVKVSLSDPSYVPEEENINDYLVHESHVHKVVNELKAAGADAVAINGQRLKSNSFIVCTGPVITIDGQQSTAPFEITGLGDPDTLSASLNLAGGVVEQLVADNITVRVETSDAYELPAHLDEDGVTHG